MEEVGRGSRGQSRVKCRCYCGKIGEFDKSEVVTKRTKSCGCLQRFTAKFGNTSIGNRTRLPAGESSFNSLLLTYKRSAVKRGYAFTLSREEFRRITKMPCHYCGVPPYHKTCYGRTRTHYNGYYIYNGIDRVNNTLGYEPNNVVACCKICQYAKRDMTVGEFISWAKRLVRHQEAQ